MLAIPGSRPAGIYTAGVVQRLINVQNVLPGRRAVILGSGDVGLIMARRMTLEGMEVVCVLEKLPQLSGLLRNKNQCLEDFDIPLHLNQTIVDIQGYPHLERVVAAKVDSTGNVIPSSKYSIDCDTLVLSVGLIPENELAKSCGIEIDAASAGPKVDKKFGTTKLGIFSCGNSLHVNALADYASEEGERAGRFAAEFVRNGAAV
jgi:NADPH-dependent 2,4-dienoyl-CoA reductase/sulfur reductase-like enzyme